MSNVTTWRQTMTTAAIAAATAAVVTMTAMSPVDPSPESTPTVVAEPVASPTPEPSTEPTTEPTAAPTTQPTQEPAPEPTPEPPVVTEVGVVSGSIRWTSFSSWQMMEDAGHKPTGIASVELLRDRVRVHHTFTASRVSSLQVSPDDAFAAAGVRVGASVGLRYTDVFFYMGTNQRPVNPALLTKRGANVWVTGSFEVAP